MATIFKVNSDKAYEFRPHYVACDELPFTGMKLTDDLRKKLGIPKGEDPKRIIFPGTRQDYQVFNGYLVPFYGKSVLDEDDPKRMDETLARHNEELIVDRARAWTQLAEPELGVKRDGAQIQEKLAQFSLLPEDTPAQCAYKMGRFKPLIGGIMTRFERLARDTLHSPKSFSAEQLDAFRAEYRNLYVTLSQSQLLPLLQQVRLTGPEVDRDGILVDLIREIGKPIGIKRDDQETMVRDNILLKISWAAESIDQTHDLLVQALTTEPTKVVFEQAVQPFLKSKGERYGMKSVDDILARLEEFTTLCRARTCIKGDDPLYDDVYAKKHALDNAFNKLLDSMRYEGRRISPETQELRSLLTAGIRLMTRTAYTRTPCNENAPEPLIPNFAKDASPMEQFMVHELFSEADLAHAKGTLERAAELPEKERRKFVNKNLSSLGHLKMEYEHLGASLLRQQIANPHNRFISSSPGTDRSGRT